MASFPHRTAVSRQRIPKPTRWLLSQGMIVGRTLDYGCGKCHDLNNLFFQADGYDPYYKPELPTGKYDTILCTFVLNVIESNFDRAMVIQKILGLLSPTGKAYIAVRNDIAKLKGRTSRGTWQGYVIPPGKLIHTCPSYRLYLLTNTSL